MEVLEIFNQAKEKLTQEYKNYYLNQVFRLAHSELDRYVISNHSEIKTLSTYLESLDYNTFKVMRAQWLKRGRMMWYACGNLGKETSKQIVEQAIQLLNLQPVHREELVDIRHVDLSSQPNNFHRLDMTVPDASNENSCLLSFYQYGR